MLQAHYRSILDLSNDALVASEKGFQKIIQSIDILEKFNVVISCGRKSVIPSIFLKKKFGNKMMTLIRLF